MAEPKEKKVKKVQARHILVKSKEIAEEVKKKVDDGEDFSTLAEEYSECPSKKRGGDLGWFGKGAMVRSFEVAAFTAEEGAVVGPIKTEFGWDVSYVYEIYFIFLIFSLDVKSCVWFYNVCLVLDNCVVVVEKRF